MGGATGDATHLADWIRWAGVAAAVAGAFEATPAGTAKVWRKAAELVVAGVGFEPT
jgi:hypothetical protein